MKAVLAIAIAVMLTARCQAQSQGEADLLCGVECLYVGLLVLEIDPGTFSTFVEKCGDVDARGFSLGRLDEIAKEHQANTLLVSTSLENLSRREKPFVCIAHVDQNHYVVIGDADRNGVWIVDPPHEGPVSREVFANRWDGKALLLSRSPLAPEESLNGWPWLRIAIAVGAFLVLWTGWTVWSRRIRS